MTTIDEMNEFDRDIILLHRKSVSEDTPPAILQKVKTVRDDISNDLYFNVRLNVNFHNITRKGFS